MVKDGSRLAKARAGMANRHFGYISTKPIPTNKRPQQSLPGHYSANSENGP